MLHKSTRFPISAQEKNCKEPRKVILWGCEGLLLSGFQAYLNAHVDWEVIRLSKEGGSMVLIQKVKETNPDVVMIDRGDCNGNVQLPMDLLQAHAGITVVTFGQDNNLAEVYNKQQVQVTEITDLLDVINRHTAL